MSDTEVVQTPDGTIASSHVEPPKPNVTPAVEPAVTTPPTGKMVPESDVLAVKRGAEKAKGELETQITGLQANLNSTHQQLLQAQADKERLEEQINQSTASQADVGKLQGERDAANTRSEDLGNQILALKRDVIATTYNVSREEVEKRTLPELELFEEALKAVGAAKKTTGSYSVTGAGGGSAPLDALGECAREITELRSKPQPNQPE